jgi:hypothetical protein
MDDNSLIADALAHNASTPLCCLPDEVLIYILRLVQGRYPHDHGPDDISGGSWEFIQGRDGLSWRSIMLVCARIRFATLHSPELWSLISTCWPESWVDLCVQRAGFHPLHLLALINNQKSARITKRLVPHTMDAYMVFEDPEDVSISEWRGLCLDIMRTDATLRSLSLVRYGLRTDSNWIPLPAPILGGEASLITHLELNYVQLEEIPHCPLLEHLQLFDEFTAPPMPNWLQRWLMTTPRLRTLKATLRYTDMRDYIGPLVLRNLEDLRLSIDLETATTLLLSFPLPQRGLHLFALPSIDATETASLDSIMAIFAYATRFWAQLQSGQTLPSVLLAIDASDGGCELSVTIMFDHGKLSSALHVHTVLNHHDIAGLGPFLPCVTTCKAHVRTLTEFAQLELHHLTALVDLQIIVVGAAPGLMDAADVQSWVDHRAQCMQSLIQIEIGYESSSHVCYTRCVIWNLADGPLVAAKWQVNPDDH